MNTEELYKLAIDSLEDMKGQDVVSLDIRKMSTIADFMLVVTATSSRHAKALANELQKRTREAGVAIKSAEGQEQAEWVLVDMGDVLVHIMQAPTRKLYDLESLWKFTPGE